MHNQAKKPTKLNPIVSAAGVMAIDNANTEFREQQAQARKAKNSWDDVNRLSGLCHRLLLSAVGLLPSLNNQRLISLIDDRATWDTNAHILARDLGAYQKNFEALRSRHVGKSGDATDDNDNMDAIDLYTQYASFYERWDGVLQPTMNHVLEQLQGAEAKLREIDNDAADALGVETSMVLDAAKGVQVQREPALTPEQDPTVVTDVDPAKPEGSRGNLIVEVDGQGEVTNVTREFDEPKTPSEIEAARAAGSESSPE